MAFQFRHRTTDFGLAGILLALAISVVAPPAHAVTADESFADGNRLFRDDLYWAALLRYRQAAEAGMNTPLLYFNSGVAHYKAGQHKRANDALLKASKSSQLRVISHYNLGLNSYAAGNNDEALRWFRRARDQEQSARLRELAIKAIARIRGQERAADTVTIHAQEMAGPKPFTELLFYASGGFGTDTNVYRSPANRYIDLSNRNQPVIVDPIVQSGTFIPVRLGAKFSVNSFEHESFFAGYRMTGKFYPEEELKNADEYSHELSFGTEYRRKKENRDSRIFSAFTVAQHHETYFDPDDGAERSNGGTSIGDRLSYVRYGPQIRTRQSWRRFSFSLWGKAQLWNYERTAAVPEYDHEYFRFGGLAQYRFTSTSLLRLSAESYHRNFSDRPSYELDGTQPLGTPTVEYAYLDFSISARQRLTRRSWFGVKYVRTERTDGYVGYNDFTRDGYGLEFSLRAGESFRIKADTTYRVYNFTNAFAFNNPIAGRKTLETLFGTITASMDFSWNLSLVGEYAYKEVVSNDIRIQYDRSQFMLSLQWNYN